MGYRAMIELQWQVYPEFIEGHISSVSFLASFIEAQIGVAN
jgi:hypothetical protein